MKVYKEVPSSFYKAKDIAEICEISVSKAYKIIAQLNAELTKMGSVLCVAKSIEDFLKRGF